MQIKVYGQNGRMAKVIREEIEQQSDCFLNQDHPEVIIDFTHDNLLQRHILEALTKGLPLVVGTTNLSNKSIDALEALSKKLPVFYAPNMNPVIHLMKKLIQDAMSTLAKTHVPEIYELHHGKKEDAPSGTALWLSKSLEPFGITKTQDYQTHPLRAPSNVGMAVSRGGKGFSIHNVSFMGESDMLEIKHSNWNSRIFAQGALQAAAFLIQVGSPGLYNMEDLLK